MDDGLPPSDERPTPRPPASGQRSRAAQPADPRKQGQPRAASKSAAASGSSIGAGTTRRQPSRAARPVIDPLVAASRGETVATPATPRPRAKRAAPAQPRDTNNSQPLTIRDDPATELSSPSGAIRRPRPPAPKPLFTDEPLFAEEPLFADELRDRSQPVDRSRPVDRSGSFERSAPIDHSGPIDRPDPVDRSPVPVIVPAETDYPPIPPPVRQRVTPPPPPSAPSIAEPFDPSSTQAIPLGELPDATTNLARRPVRAPRPPASVAVGSARPRVRRVTRVVRHVDAWTVCKVALVFNFFLYVVVLTSGVLLWQVAQNTGTVDNVERFFESFGWRSFTLHGGEIFHNAWVAGLFGVIGFTGLAVLMATLFNLITDLVGGIRVSVLEEEVVATGDRRVGWRRALRLPDRLFDRDQPS